MFDMFKDKPGEKEATATASTTDKPADPSKPTESRPTLGGFTLAPPSSSTGSTPGMHPDIMPIADFHSTDVFSYPALSLSALGGGASTSTTKPTQPAPGAGPTIAPAPAPATSGPPPSMLRGKTIDEIVGKWDSELTLQTREFSRMANEVAAWDRILMENSEKVGDP